MTPRIKTHVMVNYVGQTYSGSYKTLEGQVVVSSHYGSMSAALGAKRPNQVAAELMLKIAEGYRRS